MSQDPRESLGQLLMVGVQGYRLTQAEKDFLRTVRPAGVIYFRRNIQHPKQIFDLTKSIVEAIGRDQMPMIGIDQEGGRVARLGKPFTQFPGNDHLGRIYEETGNAKIVDQQNLAMIREMRSVGINLNFTPVADIHTNPENPIIGSRAFSANVETVADLVKQTIQKYRTEKMISCAKHFPGHGDTDLDSHLALPKLSLSKKRLRNHEMKTFAKAIKAGVPLIMTAHVIYSSLDAKYPATLSRKILQGELRKRMGFKGVIVSDDLEMNAIALHQNLDDAAFSAILAGVDLILVCKSLAESQSIYDRFQAEVEGSPSFRKRARQSVGRVWRIKKKYLKGKRLQFHPPKRAGWTHHQRIALKIKTWGGEKKSISV